MRVSRRIAAVAGLVTRGSRVADIGCDHALTSIYLMERGIASRVIAADARPGPLGRARENIRLHGYEGRIDVRLSDGLAGIRPGEADSLLMSGMGGLLMSRILTEGEDVAGEARELILQPQSEIPSVRKTVHGLGFSLVEEAMVREDGKYYAMLKAARGREAPYGSEVFYRYGKIPLERRDPILEEFLKEERRRLENVARRLEGAMGHQEGAAGQQEAAAGRREGIVGRQEVAAGRAEGAVGQQEVAAGRREGTAGQQEVAARRPDGAGVAGLPGDAVGASKEEAIAREQGPKGRMGGKAASARAEARFREVMEEIRLLDEALAFYA